MTTFITVADVDALLGSDWAGAGDPVLSVMQANAWLTSKIKRPVPVEVPDEAAKIDFVKALLKNGDLRRVGADDLEDGEAEQAPAKSKK